jgi:hypothetical protein
MDAGKTDIVVTVMPTVVALMGLVIVIGMVAGLVTRISVE